ncbi:MAG: SDR family oxidoreductase [Planctomycetes bacterium]|nr:SDR family oxidoreductase [Planctomycetota bacterium]
MSLKRPKSKGLDRLFGLKGQVVVITGGAGFLGVMHAEAVLEAGGTAVVADVDVQRARKVAKSLSSQGAALGVQLDVTRPESVKSALKKVLARYGRVDVLINNAARNPKMEATADSVAEWSRLENFPLEAWTMDLAVGLTGAFLCSQVFGGHMASQGRGVILNISSDLGLIAPDQRIYREPGVPEEKQKAKPVSYPVTKGGLLALTRYLATYWADKGVRVNSLSPGGVENGQPPEFVSRLTNLIPLGRMARPGEYKGAVVFLCSDASSYMTGANLVIDGGRTCW